MVKPVDVEKFNDKSYERILVCITAQSNSKRLITQGAKMADICNGELHILHVKQGDSIFDDENSSKLLEELFNYGSKKDGMIHFYCNMDVPDCIGRFAEEKGVTKIVFGQPPVNEKFNRSTVLGKLKDLVKYLPKEVELVVVPRKKGVENLYIRVKDCMELIG